MKAKSLLRRQSSINTWGERLSRPIAIKMRNPWKTSPRRYWMNSVAANWISMTLKYSMQHLRWAREMAVEFSSNMMSVWKMVSKTPLHIKLTLKNYLNRKKKTIAWMMTSNPIDNVARSHSLIGEIGSVTSWAAITPAHSLAHACDGGLLPWRIVATQRDWTSSTISKWPTASPAISGTNISQLMNAVSFTPTISMLWGIFFYSMCL